MEADLEAHNHVRRNIEAHRNHVLRNMHANKRVGDTERNNHNNPHPFEQQQQQQQQPQQHDRQGGQKRAPRVVVHLPAWLAQLTTLSRGLKMVLMAVAVVGSVGSVLYATDQWPALNTDGLNYSSSTRTATVTTTAAAADTTTTVDGNDHLGAEDGNNGVALDPILNNYADVAYTASTDLPLFLFVPRSGGTTLSKILGTCFGLTQANDRGVLAAASTATDTPNPNLYVGVTEVGPVVMNVETYSQEGLAHAAQQGLVRSGLADVIATPLPYEAAALFAAAEHDDHPQPPRARVFTLLRHPVERTVDVYYHDNPPPSATTLEQYATTDRPAFNYLTKLLSGRSVDTLSADLTREDVDRAKEFLKRKILVGLLSDKENAVLLFQRYFGWSTTTAAPEFCHGELLTWERTDFNERPDIGPWSPSWASLTKRNVFDMELYEYATRLTEEQQAGMSAP